MSRSFNESTANYDLMTATAVFYWQCTELLHC